MFHSLRSFSGKNAWKVGEVRSIILTEVQKLTNTVYALFKIEAVARWFGDETWCVEVEL
jgi:hypothetical protein